MDQLVIWPRWAVDQMNDIFGKLFCPNVYVNFNVLSILKIANCFREVLNILHNIKQYFIYNSNNLKKNEIERFYSIFYKI